MLKRELKRIAALSLLIIAAVTTVFLYRGWVKLSFLKPDDYLRAPDTDVTEQTTAPDVTDETEAPQISGETDVTAPSQQTPESESQNEAPSLSSGALSAGDSVRYLMKQPEKSAAAYKFADAAELLKDGYALTDAGYKDSDILASVQASFKVTNQYSKGTKTVETPVFSQATDYAERTVSYKNETVERPCLETYMGYIIYDYDNSLYLLDSSGKTLFKFDSGYKPAYTRDTAGRAMFFKIDEFGAKHYYAVSDDKKFFTEAIYSELTDGRGLFFDYPAYYGVSDDGSYRSAQTVGESVSYAYFDSNSRRLTSYRYRAAYNFREGYGAIVDMDGNSYFVGRSGYASFTYTRSYTNSSHRYVVSNFLPPLTNGIESLGFFYFDHGLARIRDRVIDHYSYYYLGGEIYVVTDEDYLVYTDGTRFAVPEGFTLFGYSDGVALLQSDTDGRYGYYDYTGAWIAQPIYTVAKPFIEGLAVIGFDGEVGVIDTNGDIVVPFAFESISNASSGVMVCYSKTGGWVIVNKLSK